MAKRLSGGSRLYLIKGGALLIGSILDNAVHKHHAFQITFALEGSFTFSIEGKEFQSEAFLINSNVEHTISAGIDGAQLMLLIEPESLYGEALKGLLDEGKGFIELNRPLCRTIRELVESEELGVELLIQTVFKHLRLALPQKGGVEERVMKVVSLIEKSPDKKMAIKELAREVSLSESRLQHLFKAQIGISIKRYLLWKRVIEGINLIARSGGGDLTMAAYDAGFSDSAHMSRTFKEMFGVNLSDIFKNSRSVQVVVEEN